MSEFIKGKITNAGERQTQFGTMYWLEVGGNQIGIGKYPAKAGIGDYVKVPIERKGQYVNLMRGGKIEKISAEEAPTPASAQSAPAGGKSYTPYNDDKRQEIISRQAARNSALTFLGQLLSAEAIAFPKTATPDKRSAILRAHLDQLTTDFNNFALGKVAADVGKDAGDDDDGEMGNSEDFE